MSLKLVFMENYEFSPKDKPEKKYQIFVFLDPNSLTILTGTDLKGTFEKGKIYQCQLEVSYGKLKVTSVN